jgi:hypothetical protein
MRKLFAAVLCLGLLCLGGCGPDSDHLAPPMSTTAAPMATSSGTDYTGAAVAAGAGLLAGHLLTRSSPGPASVVQHVTVKKTVVINQPRSSGLRSRPFIGGRRGR